MLLSILLRGTLPPCTHPYKPRYPTGAHTYSSHLIYRVGCTAVGCFRYPHAHLRLFPPPISQTRSYSQLQHPKNRLRAFPHASEPQPCEGSRSSTYPDAGVRGRRAAVSTDMVIQRAPDVNRLAARRSEPCGAAARGGNHSSQPTEQKATGTKTPTNPNPIPRSQRCPVLGPSKHN